MASFDVPSISVETRTNEENMMATKSYLYDLADRLNYETNRLEEMINSIASRQTNEGGNG